MLQPQDVIFAQYRETGIFKQRGFTIPDFMNQLFANIKDPGKGMAKSLFETPRNRKLTVRRVKDEICRYITEAAK